MGEKLTEIVRILYEINVKFDEWIVGSASLYLNLYFLTFNYILLIYYGQEKYFKDCKEKVCNKAK